jgi:hypothetical protein
MDSRQLGVGFAEMLNTVLEINFATCKTLLLALSGSSNVFTSLVSQLLTACFLSLLQYLGALFASESAFTESLPRTQAL